MTADLARRVRRGAAAALWWPACMAVAALYVADHGLAPAGARPGPVHPQRRVRPAPGRGGGVAGPGLELIDAATPWLDRVGGQVFDRCETSLQTRAFSIPAIPPASPANAASPSSTGWMAAWAAGSPSLLPSCPRPAGTPRVHRARPRPQARHLGRQLVARHRGPAPGRARDDAAGTQETVAPAHARQLGQPRRLARADVPARPARRPPRPPTARWRSTGPIPKSSWAALARHEHAIAISVLVRLLPHADVNAHPCGLRRKALRAWGPPAEAQCRSYRVYMSSYATWYFALSHGDVTRSVSTCTAAGNLCLGLTGW